MRTREVYEVPHRGATVKPSWGPLRRPMIPSDVLQTLLSHWAHWMLPVRFGEGVLDALATAALSRTRKRCAVTLLMGCCIADRHCLHP